MIDCSTQGKGAIYMYARSLGTDVTTIAPEALASFCPPLNPHHRPLIEPQRAFTVCGVKSAPFTTSNSMSTTDPVLKAFEDAQLAFRKKLKDPRLYEEILTTTKVDDVYEATAKLQETILGNGRLRNLGKISRFIKQLSSYAAVIEVFVQVKPDVLALIWGPIKLLLQWSSELSSALDQITDVMKRIGQALPQFTVLVETFEMSDAIRAALALFYEDMLDFYRVTLDFFRKPRGYTVWCMR